MLSKKELIKEYKYFKSKAIDSFHKEKIEKSLVLAQYCAYVAWMYPILYEFVDEELEDLLDQIAGKLFEQEDKHERKGQSSKRVVLYAGQLVDRGALTEQYLNFFIENSYKILLVVPDIKNTLLGENTLKQIEGNPDIEVYIPESRKVKTKITEIYRKIISYDPGNAFLHFLPNDVVGYCVFSKIKHITRYYIVHNDHTFWLGKNCSDYFLEFRKFGYLLANKRRKIEHNKLLILPYYPIKNEIPYIGFPFERKDKIVGISGANLYKYLLDPDLKYFYAIKELLKRNPNFVFCLCGWGDIKKVLPIFNDPDLKDRFYFLGKRKDFYGLVGNSDILFESYPLKGGLTVLFATEQSKAIIGIGSNKNASGCIQDWFNLKDYKEPMNIEEFIQEADILIKDPKVRNQNALKFVGNKFNKRDFDKKLAVIINEKGDKYGLPSFDGPLNLDDEYYLNEYLLLPNAKFSLLKSKLFFLNRTLSIKELFSNLVKLTIASRKRFTFIKF